MLRSKGSRIALFVFIALVTIVLFSTSIYGDFYMTFTNSLGVWDALFDGHPLSFYAYTLPGASANLYQNHYLTYTAIAAYDYPLYLIFAIWNFPLWIASRIFHIGIFSSYLCLMYAKALILFFYLLNVYFLRKLVLLFPQATEDDLFLTTVLYAVSPFILIYAIGNGNYDIIASAFCLMAFYYYAKDRYGLFLFFLSLCTSMKYFPFIILFPLILLKQKKLLYVCRDILIASGITLFSKLLFSRDGIVATQLLSLSSFQDITLFNGSSEIAVFVFLYGILCFSAWISKPENESKKRLPLAVFYCFASSICFFLFTTINPYWIVLMVPFAVLTLLISKENLAGNSILLTLFSVFHFLHMQVIWPWVPNGDVYVNLPVYRLYGYRISEQLDRVETGYPFGYYLGLWAGNIGLSFSVVNTFAILALCFYVIHANPWKKLASFSEVRLSGSILLLLVLLPIIVSFMPMLTYVWEMHRMMHM